MTREFDSEEFLASLQTKSLSTDCLNSYHLVEVEEAAHGVFLITIRKHVLLREHAQKIIHALETQLPLLDGHLVFDLSGCTFVDKTLRGYWQDLTYMRLGVGQRIAFVGVCRKLRLLLYAEITTALLYDTLELCLIGLGAKRKPTTTKRRSSRRLIARKSMNARLCSDTESDGIKFL